MRVSKSCLTDRSRTCLRAVACQRCVRPHCRLSREGRRLDPLDSSSGDNEGQEHAQLDARVEDIEERAIAESTVRPEVDEELAVPIAEGEQRAENIRALAHVDDRQAGIDRLGGTLLRSRGHRNFGDHLADDG